MRQARRKFNAREETDLTGGSPVIRLNSRFNKRIKYSPKRRITSVATQLFSFHRCHVCLCFPCSPVYNRRNCSAEGKVDRGFFYHGISFESSLRGGDRYRPRDLSIEIMVAFHAAASLNAGSSRIMNDRIAFPFRLLFHDFLQPGSFDLYVFQSRPRFLYSPRKLSIKADLERHKNWRRWNFFPWYVFLGQQG